MTHDAYRAQRRGDRGAYERYLQGMDQTMRQKVALTAAHILSRGRIADMGMGSGAGSHALASLYPGLDVVGVDVSETMVTLAREKYRLPNLTFVVGDIATPVFPPSSLDGILDSSVLHHVTSFQGYDHDKAGEALRVQVGQLAPHGVLVVRDFVDPGPGDVLLDVRCDDGDDSGDPATCSTACLLERFAREFRSLARRPGFPLVALPESAAQLPAGFRRYRLPHKLAAEFILRKDYRADWATEVQEEYTFYTQARLEELFAALGLRVLASTPIRNPWSVAHRFQGKVVLHSTDGCPLEFPPTNYVIVGERVPAGEGVRFVEARPSSPLGFLSLHQYRDRATGRVMDLIRRPNPTVDVLPWFTDDGDLFVLARMSYPRPILQCNSRGSTAIDGAAPVGYVTEPLNVIQHDEPLGTTVERALAERAGIVADSIVGFFSGDVYYPSPGGIQEEVRSALVEIEPVYVSAALRGVSGLSSSGRVGAIEACQLLRAAQVGALPDARLELNVYDLLLLRGVSPGPWIGEAIGLRPGPAPDRVVSMPLLAQRPNRRRFAPVSEPIGPVFLDLQAAEFHELDATGARVASVVLEFVVPRDLSTNTVAVAVLLQHRGEILVGVDDDDLPAAQCFSGNSQILVAPAWRLPRDVRSSTPARAWILERLKEEYGVTCDAVWTLGGRYHPSPGLTPEVVHPLAVEACELGRGRSTLHWVPLGDLVACREQIVDGHLRIVVMRAAHALGLMGG